MNTGTSITDRLVQLRQQIERACRDANRPREEVRLLAVSKTFPLSAVEEAMGAGQLDFGENYLQEALGKINRCPAATWHFIGAIQSNKTREIASHFDWVHSVPSLKIARRLSAQRDPALPPINLLVQVNITGETTKSGVTPDQLTGLLDQARELDNLRLRGLMTMPEPGRDPTPVFRTLRELRDSLSAQLSLDAFTELSMGMSHDFEHAIREGATWIRVGTGIFGARD